MRKSTRKPQKSKKGKWVFVANEDRSPEEILDERMTQVATMLNIGRQQGENPFAAADQFFDYFPGENEVKEGGAWILVKESPNTPYTVPPLSVWFAEPWPFQNENPLNPCRVKILTPKGELGLFPREYSIIKDVSKYYEYIGNGMTIKFFGGDLSGVPEMQLFYLRSRGISKSDAISMLIGNIKAHGICWLETDRNVASTFVDDAAWPHDSRLATFGV